MARLAKAQMRDYDQSINAANQVGCQKAWS
jgi:hypothetical protein